MKTHAAFILVLSTFFYFTSFSQPINPTIQWSFDTNDSSFGQAAAGDLNGDGILDIVFGCYRNDSTIYALNGADGSLLWKYNASGNYEGCNDVAPLIFDIDGDGKPEVIVPSSCNPKTYCFNGETGEVIWACPTRGSDSPPTIGYFGTDDRLKILHGEFGGYVICIDAISGTVDWEIAVDLNSWIQTAPSILDIGNDGDLDFIVATWNSVDRNDNKVYAYRAKDQELLWTFPLTDVVYHGTAIGDLDGDGIDELIIGSYNDTLYCLNSEDGSLKWSYSVGEYFYVGGPAQIADLDGDGKCEVIFTAWYSVVALTSEGELFWRYDIPNVGQAFRGAAIADINGDEYLDVVFGTTKGAAIGLNGNDGSVIFYKDLAAHYGDNRFDIDHAPLIADFDQDGNIDVFLVGGHTEYPDFSSNFGRAYLMSIGPGNGPDWLMFQGNPWRTSNICNPPSTSGILTTDSPEHSISIYPNPMQDYVTIKLTLDNAKDVHYVVSNILNEEIAVSENYQLLQGENFISWEPKTELSSGVYLLTIWVGNEKSIHKILIK